MEDDSWEGGKAIGMYLNGDGIAGKDARGGTITDDHFLLYFNADGPAQVTLPTEEYAAAFSDRTVVTSGGTEVLDRIDPDPGGTIVLVTAGVFVVVAMLTRLLPRGRRPHEDQA